MIADFARWVVGGFTAPQLTVRRLLDGNNGYDVAVQIFLLGFLIEAMALVLVGGGPGRPTGIPALIGGLISSALQLAIMVFLVYRLGRLTGGKASLKDVVMGMAWWSMMSALVLPFLLIFLQDMLPIMTRMADGQDPVGLPMPSGGVLLGATFATLTILWLLANTVAAVHGFRNIWSVVGAIVGLPLALFVVVSMVSGGGG